MVVGVMAFAGFTAGLLGIGGALIFNPVLLQLGVQPQVSALSKLIPCALWLCHSCKDGGDQVIRKGLLQQLASWPAEAMHVCAEGALYHFDEARHCLSLVKHKKASSGEGECNMLHSPMYWCFCTGDSVHQCADDPVQLLRDLSVLLLSAPAQHQLCPDPGPALFCGLPHRCALSLTIAARQVCCCSQSCALR